jgi:nickel/cobalt exporter
LDDAHLAGADAHARAHAAEISQRLAAGQTGTWQTILFGLTGGLIPCPAAITVLLICLHLDTLWLGIGLVTGFSIGLGVTLVTVGVIAAWGTRLVARRSRGLFDRWADRLPYLSSGLIGLVGIAMVAAGMSHLPAS